MLPRVPVSLWSASRLTSVHPAPTVLPRAVPTRLPAPPRVGSASRAVRPGRGLISVWLSIFHDGAPKISGAAIY